MTEIKTLIVRGAREEDLTKVMNINYACLPENYALYFFQDLYQKYPKTFIVAEADSEVIGYIMCRIEFGFSEIKKLNLVKKGHVVSVAVMPEYRKMGIGKKLLNEAFKEMMEYSATEGFLEVRFGNKEAIDLYRKMGLNIAKTLDYYYRDGESAYLMAVDLKNLGQENNLRESPH